MSLILTDFSDILGDACSGLKRKTMKSLLVHRTVAAAAPSPSRRGLGLWWQQQLAPREGNEDAFRRSTFEVAKHLFSIISIASFDPDYCSLF